MTESETEQLETREDSRAGTAIVLCDTRKTALKAVEGRT